MHARLELVMYGPCLNACLAQEVILSPADTKALDAAASSLQNRRYAYRPCCLGGKMVLIFGLFARQSSSTAVARASRRGSTQLLSCSSGSEDPDRVSGQGDPGMSIPSCSDHHAIALVVVCTHTHVCDSRVGLLLGSLTKAGMGSGRQSLCAYVQAL